MTGAPPSRRFKDPWIWDVLRSTYMWAKHEYRHVFEIMGRPNMQLPPEFEAPPLDHFRGFPANRLLFEEDP